MPTIEQIRFILEIAKRGSVNQAAKNLYISQPYLSKVLKDIEDELNITLFVRKHNGMTPTVQGTIFIEYAEQILQLTHNMKTLQYNQPKENLYLRVGSTYALNMHELFRQFREQHQQKDWQISFVEYPNRKIPEILLSKQIDLGILLINSDDKKDMMNFFANNDLTFQSLSQDKVCVIVGKKNPLFQKDNISLEELVPYNFVATKYMANPEYFLHNQRLKKDPLFFENRHNLYHYISNSQSFSLGLAISNVNDFLLKEKRIKFLHITNFHYTVEIGYLFNQKLKGNEVFQQYILFMQNFFHQLDLHANI